MSSQVLILAAVAATVTGGVAIAHPGGSECGCAGHDTAWSFRDAVEPPGGGDGGGFTSDGSASGLEPHARPLVEYHQSWVMGFAVLVEPEAQAAGLSFRRVRAALLYDLEQVARLLPDAALARVQETPVVVTKSTPPRTDWDGAGAACLHVSPEWLVQHGYDEARAGAVEILNMDKYLLWRAEQPMMILHEIAHGYHLRLEGGYENPVVLAAYDAAMEQGLYEKVGHVLESEGEAPRRAYAATNQQEYFSELTEAYFGRNDYFPFTREDLLAHDPAGYAMIEEVWGVNSAAEVPASAAP